MSRPMLLIATILTLGMASSASAAAGVTAAQSNPQTRTVVLDVENMTCAMCPITVRKSLEAVSGVIQASASNDTKTATVTYDPTMTTPDALVRATSEAGYPSTLRE